MKALIVFDSNYGNTKLIAEGIAQELAPDAKAVAVNNLNKNDLEQMDLIIVGSPINAWRPTQSILWFIYRLNSMVRKGVKVAAFDTRVRSFISGNAAKKIANALSDIGFMVIDKPQGFYVKGKEGPLLSGEIERARSWAKNLRDQMEKNLN